MTDENSNRLRFLVVEDNTVARTLLQTFLSKFGDCESAGDGAEGIVAFRESLVEKRPFDLICLDIVMPKVDGIRVLELIRSVEEKGATEGRVHRVLMTTASDETDQVRKAIKLGCDGYFVKPIQMGKLRDRMRELSLIE